MLKTKKKRRDEEKVRVPRKRRERRSSKRVDIDEDEFVVHALSESTKEDLESGEMDRRVTALEGAA